MSWAKLDDGFYDHPKVLRAGVEATGLFCLALSYASRHSTDGALEGPVLAMLSQGRVDLVATLISVGLFDDAAESGVIIHDFLTYNPSSREVTKRRKQQRVRVSRYRKVTRTRNALPSDACNALLRDGSGRVSSLESAEEGESEGEKPTLPPASPPAATPPVDGFAAWYGAYPRHEAKADAAKAWRQTERDRPPLPLLLQALGWQRGLWGQRERQYTPLPATYLRAHRWADDPPPGTRVPSLVEAKPITVVPIAARMNALGAQREAGHG